MSFLGKLFGSKASSPAAPPAPAPSDPSKDPNLVRVFDAYGRELFITKQVWRDSVLMGHIKKVWNEPDALYSAIVQALQDGFGPDMVEPAEHLATMDPNAERAAVILAIVYRDQKRSSDAEKVLRDHMARNGETGIVLTNLAKVQAGAEEQLETLWHALELDPNQENGLGWYEVIHREKGGPAAGLEALRRIAALPGAWRARLWLARAALQVRDLSAALVLYQESLALVGEPAPGDLLMQMSGDLGGAGHLTELLELTQPHFDVALHGLQVGNNLIKALLDLGRLEPAGQLVQRLYSQNRPDWKQTLSFWDAEIAKAMAAATPVDGEAKLAMTLLNIEGPVWLPDASPAWALFPAPSGEPVQIAFIGSSAETGATADGPVHQTTDGPGRLSRALPLFLAEQTHFGACARVHTIQPWLAPPHAGFVLTGGSWFDEAAAFVRQNYPLSDYVVVTHLKTFSEPWQVELRLLRTRDGQCLATAHAAFPSNQPQSSLTTLAAELLQFLAQHAGVALKPMPSLYRVPTGGDFINYQVRLEQLLAIRCSGLEGAPSHFLSGERDILDGNLLLCLNQPKNASVRILLLQSCLSMARIRPEIVREYREKLERLQNEHPLEEPVKSVLQRFLADMGAM